MTDEDVCLIWTLDIWPVAYSLNNLGVRIFLLVETWDAGLDVIKKSLFFTKTKKPQMASH